MFTGWPMAPFKLNRKLGFDERYSELPKQAQTDVIPYQFSALLRLNSTYAEFIDRKFRVRGMVNTAGWLLGGASLAILAVILVIAVNVRFPPEEDLLFNLGFIVAVLSIGLGAPYFFWRHLLRHDLFTYTHYPIRFNRKTRKVHVFRHNGPGGVLTVPFDEVFWHIGRGEQQKYLCDVRGHVLDGETVIDTFAVGHYYDDARLDRIHSIWELIRRYMDEGPEAAAEHPLDKLIELSAKPSWLNCYLWVTASMGPGMHAMRYMFFFVIYPIRGLLTLSRWLTLNSGQEPRWPAEIEAECQIEPGDPHRWEEPSYLGEFGNRPGVIERMQERESRVQKSASHF